MDSEFPRSLLDTDWYKYPMSAVWADTNPRANGVFELTNRTRSVRLLDYMSVEAVRERLDHIASLRLTPPEVAFVAAQPTMRGRTTHHQFLSRLQLPPAEVGSRGGDLSVRVEGRLPVVTFWETPVMSTVKRLYVEGYCRVHDIREADLVNEGRRRLRDKINLLRSEPGMRLMEFGTRRRAGLSTQLEVIETLLSEAPDQLLGTSNTDISHMLDLTPLGTYAHELDMGYAAIHGDLATGRPTGQARLMDDLERLFGAETCIGLSDTFGVNYFLSNFRQRADRWKGSRHDSGDPFEFGERMSGFYEELAIDPREKTIVFSDGLDIPAAIELYRHFAGRIQTIFGIGTNLTDDRGFPPPISLVMKLMMVDGIYTLKLPANIAKAMGRPEDIALARQIYNHHSNYRRECVV